MKTSLPLLRRSRSTLVAGLLAGSFLLCGAIEAAPPKWEYTVVSARLKNRNLENLLNQLGAQGWELVQINESGIAVLKRIKRK